MQRTVSILGCGWLGLQLGEDLIAQGYLVKGSTVTPARIYELAEAEIQPFYLNIEPDMKYTGSELFFKTDVLVISLPPQRELNIEKVFPEQIAEIAELAKFFHIPRVLFISSTSVFEKTDREVREGEEGNPEQPAGKALLKAEKMLLNAKDFQTTVVRFGGLIGPGRNPARFFTKKKNISGNVPVNLIHSKDAVNIISEIIGKNVWGEVFNASCPVHPTRWEFYTLASEISGMPAPDFTRSAEKYKIVNSEKLLEKLNYTFHYANPLDYLFELSKK